MLHARGGNCIHRLKKKKKKPSHEQGLYYNNKKNHSRLQELLMLGSELAQLDLQPGPLFSRIVQRAPRVRQLGLIQRFKAGQLPAPHLFLFGNLQVKNAVFWLETPDFVDVNGQAVVEVAQLLFLLQPGDPRGAQRSAATRSGAHSLAGRGGSRGRHCKLKNWNKSKISLGFAGLKLLGRWKNAKYYSLNSDVKKQLGIWLYIAKCSIDKNPEQHILA